jgi:hypothetical protein
LRYDGGSGGTVWTELIGRQADSVALTYTVSSPITVGDTYLFQYAAKNVHGWSDWSASLSLVAASPPDQISPAAVTFNEGTDVRVSWTLPASDGGKPVLSYTILFLGADGTYSTDSACDGASATVRANLYCLIPMVNLRAGPHSHTTIGTTVIATVSATNEIGTSTASAANTAGASIKTEPGKPDSPTRVDSGTTDQQVMVAYASPVVDGGSTLTSLALYWDAGTSGATWTALHGSSPYSLDTQFTVSTGITIGALYQFKHRARNIFGEGEYSDPVTVKAATKPDQILTLTTSVVAGSNVRIAWTAPDNRGDTITAYQVLVQTSSVGTFTDATASCARGASGVLSNAYCDIALATL